MELTNYWWLLIWLFTGGLVLNYLAPKRYENVCGKMECRWNWLPAIGFVLPYIIWAAGRRNFGDTQMYLITFRDAPSVLAKIPEYLQSHTKDKGYSIFMIVEKALLGNSELVFFLIIAIIQLFCIVRIYRKYSTDYWTSMFLFIVSTDYLSWMHNGIRQFLAATLIFSTMDLVLEKKYIKEIVVILVASTIHGSALIMLPIIFIVQGKALNKKTMMVLLSMLAAVLMIDKFTPILNELLADTQYNDMIGNEIWAVDNGTSVMRVLVYSVPALFAIIGRKYIKHSEDPVINLCVNSSLITMGLYLLSAVSSGIYIGRLPIYTSLTGYILLPWLIEHMFTENSAKIIRTCMYGAYLVFFYFQMHFAWAML